MMTYLLLAVLPAVDVDKANEQFNGVMLKMEANSREIEVGEPLFVKVTVTNNSDAAACFRTEISSLTGLLRLDLRTEGGEWKETAATDQGAVAFIDAGRCIAPKDSHCTFSAIFTVAGRIVFDTPGRYELRSRIQSEGGELLSEAIGLTIVRERPAQFEFLSSHKPVLIYLLPRTGLPPFVNNVKPIKFDSVPPGRIRSYLEGNRLSMEWMQAKPGTRAAEQAEKRVIEFANALDPVMKDEYYKAIAFRYLKERRFGDAMTLVDQLTPSEWTIAVRKQIAQDMQK